MYEHHIFYDILNVADSFLLCLDLLVQGRGA